MIHLNPPSQTPPVDIPLLVQLDDGSYVRCIRKKYARSHDELLEFHTDDGKIIIGRLWWTYP